MVEPKQEVKAINVNSNFNDWPDNSTGGDPLLSNEEPKNILFIKLISQRGGDNY